MSQEQNIFDDIRVDALARAIINGDQQKVRALLLDGVPLNSVAMIASKNFMVEHYAFVPEDPAILRMLLEAGADPVVKGTHSLIEIAASRPDRVPHLRVLLDEFNVDANAVSGSVNHPPLSYAISGMNVVGVGLLLERGANPNWKNEFNTLLHMAMASPQLEIALLLVNYGADPRVSVGNIPNVLDDWCEVASWRAMAPDKEFLDKFSALDDAVLRKFNVNFPCTATGKPKI